ncbi:hypothetical protein I7I50_07866 [Histoplasma capsulatum G186AR]|uniref:Uncharacterized protein n=1 Tax=Ajellomyces capsulatus TaxID=5037 RepID=A0A8H7YKC4_AJECA|nr:hypothetical protein I7I52_08382 [Histoplasma capsulatum]QSS68452.1 hypothetical protein I7I50_07866 [Histoplasma capsulatum G186AR]
MEARTGRSFQALKYAVSAVNRPASAWISRSPIFAAFDSPLLFLPHSVSFGLRRFPFIEFQLHLDPGSSEAENDMNTWILSQSWYAAAGEF